MGRSIITTTKQPGLISAKVVGQGDQPDNYANQIIKLIPADVVGVYIAISKLLETADWTYPTLQWSVFFIILLITPFYLKRTDSQIDKRQIMVATLSFIVWTFSIGGPFEKLFQHCYPLEADRFKIIASVVIMIYTLIVPLLYKKPEPSPIPEGENTGK